MKTAVLLIVLLLAGAAIASTYHAYRQRTRDELAARRAQLATQETERQRREAAEKEAHRLTTLQAEQTAALAAQAAAEEQAAREAAERRHAENEAERQRLDAQLAQLRRESDAMIAEVKRLSETRPDNRAELERAQADALEKLRALETEKHAVETRQAVLSAELATEPRLERKRLEVTPDPTANSDP